jgi:tetratricopeptide (TPR) repeat protein
MWDVSRDDEYLVPLLEGALAALGRDDSSLRVRLLARLAGGPLRDASFPPERKAALSREALEMARRIGDPATLAYALDGYIPANESPENTRELLGLSDELLRVATEVGDKERAVEAYEHRVGRLLELGEMSEARAGLEAMAKLADELRQPAQQWLVAVCEARLALLEGRLGEAEGLIAEALDLGERAQSWNAAVAYRLQLYLLRREQGRLEEVKELVRGSVEEYPTYPIWRCVAAQMAAELGLEAESRRTFEALARDAFSGLRFEELWLVSLGFLAETAGSLGDAAHAPLLYQLLIPYADHVAVIYPEISTGSVARYLGLLAATMERWDDAERHFENALKMNGRIGARPWLAHTQEDHARMLLARRAPGDEERALALLADARSNYRNLGMSTLAERASLVDQPPKGGPRRQD